jgi:uncharacterized protein
MSRKIPKPLPLRILDRLGSSPKLGEECQMQQRLSLITLGVADLKRSIHFYERLRWRRSVRNAEGVAFFQLPGIALGLYPREELAKDANVSADGGGFRGLSLAYNTRTRDEVDTVLSEAESAGGTIIKHAQDAFWGGYSGYFSDPDGFLWEVAWNPSFRLAEDGSLQLPD